MADEVEKQYEVGCLMSPLIAQEKVADEVAVLRSALESNGAAIMEEGSFRIRPLAYPVLHVEGGQRDHYEQSYFGYLKFRALPSKAEAIREALKAIPHLIRFLLMVAPVRPAYEAKGPLRARVAPRPEEKRGEIDEGAIDKEIESLLTAAA